jgi:hypothetical protein
MTLAEFIEKLAQQNTDFKIWIEEWRNRLEKQQSKKDLLFKYGLFLYIIFIIKPYQSFLLEFSTLQLLIMSA